MSSISKMTTASRVQIFNSYEDLQTAINKEKAPTQVVQTKWDFPVSPENIDTLDQLLELISFITVHKVSGDKYRRLADCYDVISRLNSLIGLTDAKTNMAHQILSLCERSSLKGSTLNSVIYGPPGCGKTTMAHILADIYLKLGAVKESKLVKGDRANLIGAFIGETAIKTKKVLQSALNGVLFIDEAYQLGHAADGNRCPYAYECINTINQFITEQPGKIVIILAGYEKDIIQNFFAQNDGLARRFPFKFTINGYSEQDLIQIFKHQAKEAGYSISENAFEYHQDLFKDKTLFEYYGGDTENLFNCCRIVNEKRMFAYAINDHIITQTDVEKGVEIFRKHKGKRTDDGGAWHHMYL